MNNINPIKTAIPFEMFLDQTARMGAVVMQRGPAGNREMRRHPPQKPGRVGHHVVPTNRRAARAARVARRVSR